MIKFAFIAAVALTFAAAPASASDGSWRVGNDQIHLIYNDVDTNTAAGRATMLARIERAAVRLCRDRVVDERQCARDIVDDAALSRNNKWLGLALAERDGRVSASR